MTHEYKYSNTTHWKQLYMAFMQTAEPPKFMTKFENQSEHYRW